MAIVKKTKQVYNIRENMITAFNAKGVFVEDDTPLSKFPDIINQILSNTSDNAFATLIKSIIANRELYPIGTEVQIPMNNGVNKTFLIAEYDKVRSNTITLIAKEIFTTLKRITVSTNRKSKYDGYTETSKILNQNYSRDSWTYALTDVYRRFSNEVRSMMIYENANDANEQPVCANFSKVYPVPLRAVNGSSMWTFMSTNAQRVKNFNGIATNYWINEAGTGGTNAIRYIKSDGSVQNYVAGSRFTDLEYGLCPVIYLDLNITPTMVFDDPIIKILDDRANASAALIIDGINYRKKMGLSISKGDYLIKMRHGGSQYIELVDVDRDGPNTLQFIFKYLYDEYNCSRFNILNDSTPDNLQDNIIVDFDKIPNLYDNTLRKDSLYITLDAIYNDIPHEFTKVLTTKLNSDNIHSNYNKIYLLNKTDISGDTAINYFTTDKLKRTKLTNVTANDTSDNYLLEDITINENGSLLYIWVDKNGSINQTGYINTPSSSASDVHLEKSFYIIPYFSIDIN